MTTAVLNLAESTHGTVAMFRCPGCDDIHAIPVDGNSAWQWNRSTTRPTFSPSVLVNSGGGHPAKPVCHSFVTDGVIRFLSDCTHDLAGTSVALPAWSS